jgi:hypothetical protein
VVTRKLHLISPGKQKTVNLLLGSGIDIGPFLSFQLTIPIFCNCSFFLLSCKVCLLCGGPYSLKANMVYRAPRWGGCFRCSSSFFPLSFMASSTSSLTDFSDPFFLYPNKSSSQALIPILFKGDYYHTWSRAMLRVLRTKNKLGFIDDSISRPSSLMLCLVPGIDAIVRCSLGYFKPLILP